MKKIILVLLASFLLLAGCNSVDSTQQKTTGLLIYTSIYPIEYFTERIGGSFVDARTIIPPGADAHTYEPTAKTLTNIAKGKAFIFLGGNMEAFSKTIANALEAEPVKMVELADQQDLFLKDEDDHDEEEHDHGGLDPHIWLDPIRAIEMAAIIKQELIGLDSVHKDVFEQNFQDLKTDLLALDKSFKEMLKDKKDKTILVSHAAYGYWEYRYGLEQLAIRGLTPGAEPSQKDIQSIITSVRKKHIPYVIFEQNTSDAIAKVIQNETNINALRIHNLSVLTKEDIKTNQNYFTLMNRNIKVLNKALTIKE